MALFWTLLWLPLYAMFHCYLWVRSVGDALSSPLWLAIDQGHCFCDHYTTEGDRLHLQGDDQRPVWEPSGSVFLRRIIDMHSHRHTHTHLQWNKASLWHGEIQVSLLSHSRHTLPSAFELLPKQVKVLWMISKMSAIRCCWNYKWQNIFNHLTPHLTKVMYVSVCVKSERGDIRIMPWGASRRSLLSILQSC